MLIPYKNPYLFVSKLTEQFIYIDNLSKPKNGKIINNKQAAILDLIDGFHSVPSIAKILNFRIKDVNATIRFFEKYNIVSYNNQFEEVKSKKIKSMSLWIHTTNECNLHCKYCYISTVRQQSTMKDDTIELLCKRIKETVLLHNLQRVSLRLSGGECFLVLKNWESFILQLKRDLKLLNCHLSLCAITNLTILDDNMIQLLKRLNISISCSLDGIGHYNDYNRCYSDGTGSYDIVIRNICKLLKEGVYPNILIVVNNNNAEGLLEFTKTLVNLKVHFRYSIVQDEDVDYDKIKSRLYQCYDFLSEQIKHGYSFIERHNLNNIDLSGVITSPCGMGINSAAVYVDGQIYMCQMDFGIKDSIGTIKSEISMLDIINNGEKASANILDCRSCLYLYKCAGGCPRHGNKKDMCDINKEFIPVILKLAGQQRLYRLLNGN